MSTTPSGAEVGLTVVHRTYVSYAHAHYAGHLVDGAWGLGLFGDVATEMCIRTDGDEGLFASYSDVQFLAPVRAGDVVEARATLVRAGARSRQLEFALVVVARGEASGPAESSARMLAEPIVATTAVGTVVVPAPGQ
jgi:3-aminobutyryl-CoA ammonia-lyase